MFHSFAATLVESREHDRDGFRFIQTETIKQEQNKCQHLRIVKIVGQIFTYSYDYEWQDLTCKKSDFFVFFVSMTF